MASEFNIWINQLDTILPQQLRTDTWKDIVQRAPRTTTVYDKDVKDFIDEWEFVRLLPMLTSIATFSGQGDEWRAMLDRRILKMYRFKNFTLNKILSLLDREIPQYAQAIKLALREVYTLRRTWRGHHTLWVTELDIVETTSSLAQIAEYGWQRPTPQD